MHCQAARWGPEILCETAELALVVWCTPPSDFQVFAMWMWHISRQSRQRTCFFWPVATAEPFCRMISRWILDVDIISSKLLDRSPGSTRRFSPGFRLFMSTSLRATEQKQLLSTLRVTCVLKPRDGTDWTECLRNRFFQECPRLTFFV